MRILCFSCGLHRASIARPPCYQRLRKQALSLHSWQGGNSAERDDFAPYVSKSVPQRLKPSSAQPFTARLNPCPSCRDAFSLSMFSVCTPDDHFVRNAP